MPPVVINVRHAEDLRDVVHRAVQALAEGKIVAFPTETVYGVAASARHAAAVERLLHIKGRAIGQPLTLAIKSSDDALDFVPHMPPLAVRLARRCWPGPVTLVLDDNHPHSLLHQLPENVQQAICPNGSIGLRVPAHPFVLDVMRLLAGPLALTSANRRGQPDAVTAEEVVAALGDDVQLVFDDGRSQFGQPSSVVRVQGAKFEILRAGVMTAQHLQRLASYSILLVCTGNTCRSPMAEQLLRKRVADRLGCALKELEDRGVVVQSAGIAAYSGGRATAEAVEAMAEKGLDLGRHQSQPLTDRLVASADLIYTMTRGHREALLAQWPEAAGRVDVLAPERRDVADPIGGTRDDYRRCAEQIDAALAVRIHELDLPKQP